MAAFSNRINFIHGTVKTALCSLLQHKLRTSLSILGVICGVMAVVAIVAIGQGAKRKTLKQIEQMGVTNIFIRADQLTPAQHNRARRLHSAGLQKQDSERLQHNNPFIRRTAASREQAVNLTGLPQHLSPKLVECTASYGEILSIDTVRGRFITPLDVSDQKQVCVLGWRIARDIGVLGGVGSSLRIGDQIFRVVGILQRQDMLNTVETKLSLQNLNETIFFPLDTIEATRPKGLNNLNNQVPLTEIIVEIQSADLVMSAGQLIGRSLEVAHNGVDDFQLIIPLELLAQASKVQGIFNLVLGIIGAISLVIGGIGIMNIMLANISERIKEIGLRRALGARPTHIVVQFLTEAVLLTTIGGLLGIIGGIGLTLIISLSTKWPVSFSSFALTVPLGVSIFVGLLFGLYPAKKASIMDPITALNSGY